MTPVRTPHSFVVADVHFAPNDKRAEMRIAEMYARASEAAVGSIVAVPLLDNQNRQVGISFTSPDAAGIGLLVAAMCGAVAFGFASRVDVKRL